MRSVTYSRLRRLASSARSASSMRIATGAEAASCRKMRRRPSNSSNAGSGRRSGGVRAPRKPDSSNCIITPQRNLVSRRRPLALSTCIPPSIASVWIAAISADLPIPEGPSRSTTEPVPARAAPHASAALAHGALRSTSARDAATRLGYDRVLPGCKGRASSACVTTRESRVGSPDGPGNCPRARGGTRRALSP
jgi:hypothetical protein